MQRKKRTYRVEIKESKEMKRTRIGELVTHAIPIRCLPVLIIFFFLILILMINKKRLKSRCVENWRQRAICCFIL